MLKYTLISALFLTLLACSGSSHSGLPSASGPPPVLAAGGVASPTLFVGQTGTLSVNLATTSTGPYTFQWLCNGQSISGATAQTYALPSVALAQSGQVYTVRVSNPNGPTLSPPMTLTVLAPLDLRFKLVGFTPFLDSLTNGVSTNLNDFNGTYQSRRYSNSVGAPFLIGSGLANSQPVPQADWFYGVGHMDGAFLGMNTLYQDGPLSNLVADLNQALAPGGVVTSLDAEEDAQASAFAIMSSSQEGAFLPVTLSTAAAADLPSKATQLGASGQVITAVSYANGQITFVAHGWTEANTMTYDAQVLSASYGTLEAQATALANQGYVITALGAGHNAIDGFILVGTRASGSTTPRTLAVKSIPGPASWRPQVTDLPGFGMVGECYDAPSNTSLLLFEK